MTAERSEDSGLAGVLLVTMDGRPYRLPVLKIKHSREWKDQLGAVVKGVELDDDLGVTVGRLANLASDTALDLVLAYDRTNVLGGKVAIEEQATDAELFRALEGMVTATYPFEGHIRSVAEAFGPQIAQMARAIVPQLATLVTQVLAQANSSPTSAVNGGLTPTPLRSVSPTSSSSSATPTTSMPDSPKSATGAT